RIAVSKGESAQESGPTYVTSRPLVSEIRHRKPGSKVEAAPLAVGFVSLNRDSWMTRQPPYIATAVAVETIEKSTHNGTSDVTNLSAIAARQLTISAAITTARCRFIAHRWDSTASRT